MTLTLRGTLRACLCCLTMSALCAPAAVHAQSAGGAERHAHAHGGDGAQDFDRNASQLPPLPPDKTTEHVVTINGQPLHFSATAGVIRLLNAQTGDPIADVSFISYVKDGVEARSRPVAFVFNGGPGYASGWLNLGGIGPWRLPMQGDAARPSAPPVVADNSDSWLDFTDLVFIDPPGAGYSRVLGNDEVRKSLWSVDGDIQALATTVRRWTERNNRMTSPKFIVGESYGGFRAPKIAHVLQTDQGVGVNGLAMISPALEFEQLEQPTSLMSYVGALPSMAAVAREAKGPIARSDLADVERYAQGDFLDDLLKGPNDAAAVARLSTKVADLTGLDPALVRQLGGRVEPSVFQRAFWRSRGKIASQYDGSVAGYDPTPDAMRSRAGDQLRIGLHAPIVEAMVDLYHSKLEWTVERGRYQFLNDDASRNWTWGRHAEAVSDLRDDLALDPNFHVLIAQGLTDLVTPYFATQMEIDQIPNYGAPGRLALHVYPGGHMVYIRDDSRKKLADDARALFTQK